MFDFLKRRDRPKEWQPGTITFVGEQSGPAEDGLKQALATRFTRDPRIRRAYLVRVSYPKRGPQRARDENRGREGDAAPVEVLLCLVAPEDAAIVSVVGEEFEKVFHPTQHMDTLFLSDALEREVAKVARPFYASGITGSG